MGLYRDVLFPSCYDMMMKHPGLDARRTESLATVAGDVLEVGIGTGLNLDHYPASVTRLVAVEPNAGMAKQLAKKATESPIEVELVVAPAEALPFEDARFDTVVSTHVLCSVEDIPRSLAEIRRVLRPGGQLVFLEHGLSHDHGVQKWQHRLNPIQRLFGAGCRLDVPMRQVIEAAGFDIRALDQGYVDGQPKTHGFLYQGRALRPV